MTASGAIEMPLGTTKDKVKFIFARDTQQMCIVMLLVPMVDTTEDDVLLGMEFITVMCGAYDVYIETLTY